MRVSPVSVDTPASPPSPATPVLERGCLRHDGLINYTFSVPQFEPESEKTKRTFSVCACWSFPPFRSESDSESPEGARHGTATGPARVERKRVVGRGRREGGVEKEGGG